ncbi:hypothetical protein [Mucilaginibacter sp. SJ]|uniref:hypothetical protein n=1 Tax=Mucilaginibacter sp. SJ TaxID=3029053 RepID=UPI0023A9BA24|nr:hypothetical protein [Mucilaginibacter sp. SJ]WEA03846.1 hypothetical protein MusilaSJ_12965 [Mucilaginibacter sp. SJ]
MFNLFKSKKKRLPVETWEMVLIKNALKKLPKEFESLINQIDEKLFLYSLVGYSSAFPDYVAFSFAPTLINKFEKKKEADYEITDIRVFDSHTSHFKTLTIHVSEGVICGYTLSGPKDVKIDAANVDVSRYVKKRNDNVYYDNAKKLLAAQDLELVSQGNVYEVILNGKLYYHIKELEDGDFIGVDSDGILYNVTHDPFEITPLNKSLKEFLGA